MNHVIYGTGNEISLLAMSSRKLTTIVADWVTLNGTVRKFVQRFPHKPELTLKHKSQLSANEPLSYNQYHHDWISSSS